MTLCRIKRSLGRRQSLWWPFRRFRFGKRHTFALGAETMPCDGASFLCCSTFLFPVCGGHCSCLSQCLRIVQCVLQHAVRFAHFRTSTGQAWSRVSVCPPLVTSKKTRDPRRKGSNNFLPKPFNFCSYSSWMQNMRLDVSSSY